MDGLGINMIDIQMLAVIYLYKLEKTLIAKKTFYYVLFTNRLHNIIT